MQEDIILNTPETEGEDDIALMPEVTEVAEAAVPEEEALVLAEEPVGAVPVPISEEPSLRGENRKVFNMSDGTQQAVFYAEPVHTYDEEEQRLVEIDNTLILEEDRRHFRNGKSNFIARFSNEENSDELFSIEKGAYKLVLSLRKNARGRSKGVQPLLTQLQRLNGDMTVPASKLAFEDMAEHADFEYEVGGDRVKENIVIKQPAPAYRYAFRVVCDNLELRELPEEKALAFLSAETAEEIFRIPAPFMTDADGAHSDGVFYEVREGEDGAIELSVIADSDWINAEGRAFPVTIDPQVIVQGSGSLTTYSWLNGTMYTSSTHKISCTSKTGGCNTNRMYMKLTMPSLPRNPRIKKAELTMRQLSGAICHENARVGLYRLTQPICTGNCTPAYDANMLDYEKLQSGAATYTFDVTALIDSLNKGEVSTPNLMFRMLNELGTFEDNVTWYSSTNSTYGPQLKITYESSYGVGGSSRTHTHELGRFGTAAIDLQCGNLTFDSEDFAWGGNRKPVTIRHYYNSALSNYQYKPNSAIGLYTGDFRMKMGRGWRLNWMQSVVSHTFVHEGTSYAGYLYIDDKGDEFYFKEAPYDEYKRNYKDSNGNTCEYYLYEAISMGLYTYDPHKRELYIGKDTYFFDGFGKLIRIKDDNNNTIHLNYSSLLLTSITDGAGREFALNYNSNYFLTSIVAPDGSTITYSYENDCLKQITYPDGRMVEISCPSVQSYRPTEVKLKDSTGNIVYRTTYTYDNERVEDIKEYGYQDGMLLGQQTSYTYGVAARKTTVTTIEQADGTDKENHLTTVYTFRDDGSVLSRYAYTADSDKMSVGEGGSGINPYAGDGGASVVGNVSNLLLNHSFDSLDSWTNSPSNCKEFGVGTYTFQSRALFGNKYLRMQTCNKTAKENGIYQVTNTLPAGKYAFSLYVQMVTNAAGSGVATNPGAYLKVTTTSGTILGESEHLAYVDSDYVRLVVPFELTSAQSVKVGIYLDGEATMYADAAQLEEGEYANTYNLLTNGNFERNLKNWIFKNGASVVADQHFNMSKSLRVLGSLDLTQYAKQEVFPKSYVDARETFTLSGWAKANALPRRNREGSNEAQFRLRACIIYDDESTEEYTADFQPCTEEWQFTSVTFSKKEYKKVEQIDAYCEYNYNTGTAYFDAIQLSRERLETGLKVTDFISEMQVPEEELQEHSAPEVIDKIQFEEARDGYGNVLTRTNFENGEFGAVYRSFGYNDPCAPGCPDGGNDLVRETDARGNQTLYKVDADTSRNETVTDRCGNQTAYAYDATGRMTKLTAKNASGTSLANVSYSYDAFDNLSTITRGDAMQYELTYNRYHKIQELGIAGLSSPLVQYRYKNGNGRLKQVTYANGDSIHATYNQFGQVVAEVWKNATNVVTASYRYVYNNNKKIVRSIDILCNMEYNYTYEKGRLARSTESSIVLNSSGTVTKKTLTNTTFYRYDQKGRLIKKVVRTASGEENSYVYEYPEQGPVVVQLPTGTKAHSKKDHLGRKVFDELQLGSGMLSREFQYVQGQVTSEHKNAKKLTSSPTTNLVSELRFADGRTIAYEYDAEERIKKVTDSVEGVTSYTYDAQDQLTSETKGGVTIGYEYDAYGNLQAKGPCDEEGNLIAQTKIDYGYDETGAWKDRMLSYDGQFITYDAGGNPLQYRGYTFQWKKGRELYFSKDADGQVNTYTYNANGIRTSKTVCGVLHQYLVEGTKILRETYGNNKIDYLYDNESSICGLILNGTAYYFYKNLQGDVIAITDKDGVVKARYSYDAWGACTVESDTSGANIASINPFRYRSYYFDVETGFYYLNSRYYDPIVGRFINADDSSLLQSMRQDILGFNLYAYCANCPINYSDPRGRDYAFCQDVGSTTSVDKIESIIDEMSRQDMESVIDQICQEVGKVTEGISDVSFFGSIVGYSIAPWIMTGSTIVGLIARLVDAWPKIEDDYKKVYKVTDDGMYLMKQDFNFTYYFCLLYGGYNPEYMFYCSRKWYYNCNHSSYYITTEKCKLGAAILNSTDVLLFVKQLCERYNIRFSTYEVDYYFTYGGDL